VITIVDLGISNIKSITRGFVTQGFEVSVTATPEEVSKAVSLVLPGVGAFPKAVEVLRGKGLWDVIKAHAASGKPLLGICLGMQLLFTDSDEHVLTEGLGLVPGHVRRFPPDRPVPHMGWNEVVLGGESPLFRGVADRSAFYFVHSYYGEPDDPAWETGSSDHGGRFTAAVQRGNVFGTQFHPEKSQDRGLAVLRNFAGLAEE
jgi:imidazole glycerol-phosphate synthase subunit HisH